jgi:hypothetical protein
MKSFILPLPKTPSKIDYYYFCECGRRFVSSNDNEVCKCGNSRFYDYSDVKKYNKKLYEIKETKYEIECFIEYPVFNKKIILKKERLAVIIDKEIKLNQKFRENINFYFEEISKIVKLYLKFFNLWKKRKKVFEILKSIESKRILELIKAKDAEVLLWYVYNENISVKGFFEKPLKDSPKSVKKAVFEKYKKQVTDLSYNPLIDILILKVIEDINHQRELIKISSQYEFDIPEINDFIDFLKKFKQTQIVKFLKKTIQNKTLSNYIHKFDQSIIKKFYGSIEETILNGDDFVNYEYPFKQQYEFNEFIFKLPQNSLELKEYGNKLKNCLSNYIGIHNKRYLIFGVFKGKELKYAVNFDTKTKFIVEAKGFANTIIHKKDYKIIKSFFDAFKEVI